MSDIPTPQFTYTRDAFHEPDEITIVWNGFSASRSYDGGHYTDMMNELLNEALIGFGFNIDRIIISYSFNTPNSRVKVAWGDTYVRTEVPVNTIESANIALVELFAIVNREGHI